MARKQAKRRKLKKQRQLKLPSIPFARISAVLAAGAIIVVTYHFSMRALDHPIEAISVAGPFQRVSALKIEEAVSGELDKGFLSANLAAIQQSAAALPWIDSATVE
ncbi:MAG: FtsQ-type POTRA domain-containing protein, partial [Gammaproteobacteria bacterium]|nr:FtsQ-type POTRA domain-containing protein [Gammaproteobacteria bacterium]